MLTLYVDSLARGDGKSEGTKTVLSNLHLEVKVSLELSCMTVEMGFPVLSKRKSHLFQNW